MIDHMMKKATTLEQDKKIRLQKLAEKEAKKNADQQAKDERIARLAERN